MLTQPRAHTHARTTNNCITEASPLFQLSPSSCSAVVLDSGVSVAPTAAAVVGAPLTDITMSTKAMSVVSVTSQCSYSSTIVHVPQPESGAVFLQLSQSAKASSHLQMWHRLRLVSWVARCRSHGAGGRPNGERACRRSASTCPSCPQPRRRGAALHRPDQRGAVGSHPEGGAGVRRPLPPPYPPEPLQLLPAAGQQLHGSLPPPRFVFLSSFLF